MAKHRPVNQRIAETMAHLAALQAKANKEAVNDDPRIKEIDNSMLKYNRWVSEWEQKVEDFQERVVTWEVRGVEATEKVKEANKQLRNLKDERKTLGENIAQEIADTQDA